MAINATTIASTTFPSLIVDNGGMVFALMLLVAILFVSVKMGIKDGMILYLIAGLVGIISVIIGAISFTFLIYLTIPLILLIVIKFVMGGRQ